ncbi:Phosphoglycerate mutase family [Phytophthora cinnamomi]|uniref:Phosphoglycerate mutase family n=1 Tax=Phytophthora cinnamomi TaxID=4785 RepID=UPI003559F7B2|nr:Phosphoglycerate mutase family [Phytophthora cinnamomi]
MSMSGQLERPLQRRGGRVRGAEGYHREDILALLKCVRHVVPTTAEEWDQVLEEYRETHAGPKGRSLRDAHSLKVKFKQLARSFAPGKDAHPDVQEAGAIVDMMEAKTTDGKCLQRRGGRVRGAEGFSPADSQAILSAVRHLLPVHRSDWEQVADEYCREYAVPNDRVSRDGVSLKHKFRTWLRADVEVMPRSLVTEALAIQSSIVAKTNQLGKAVSAQLDDLRSQVEVAARPADDRRGSEVEAEASTTETASPLEKSAPSSEGGGNFPVSEPRRGGRTLGSEGYTRSDMRALLACVKQVLPVGPASWEQVLQLYRMNHCIPNERSQRNVTGVKSKFRQLVNWKHDRGKAPSEEVLEARSIQREIDLSTRLGKHPRSENGSTSSFPHSPEADNYGEQPVLLVHGEARNNENLERQNVADDATGWSVSSQHSVPEPAVKRPRQDGNVKVAVPMDPESEAVRSEIASRELELLRQREQREAEQAAWEKERSLREKQRMDMEAWTFVCDRLRALYREHSTETDLEIVNEIKDEIAVLKKKKQRLAGLM